MDVEQPPLVVAHEAVGEHAHEPREHDQVGRMGVDAFGQRGVEAGTVAVRSVIDHCGGDAVRAREREPFGRGTIADHRRDVDARDARTHDGFHVAAATRDENDDGLHEQTAGLKGIAGFAGPGGDQ